VDVTVGFELLNKPGLGPDTTFGLDPEEKLGVNVGLEFDTVFVPKLGLGADEKLGWKEGVWFGLGAADTIGLYVEEKFCFGAEE